ncbi:MAG TPA: SRPBCC family protein [Candidatus Solibacter sp.]|nr:SRPBCC family protein [Candidatus Solibacter sp.]
MNQFEIVTTIDRPVSEVWAFLEDFDRMPEWNAGLTKAYPTSEGPLGVGTKIVFEGKFLGRSFEITQEYTEYIPNQRFIAKTAAGPFHLELESTLEPTQDGTKLTNVYRGESRGFVKLAEPVVVRLVKKQLEAAAETMKALMEAAVPDPA